MRLHVQKFFGAMGVLTIAACAGNSLGSTTAPTPSPSPVTLSAMPASYTFALDRNSPQPVNVARSSGSFASLALSVANPTVVGVSIPTLSGASAMFSIIPIAHGSTTIKMSDQTGATSVVTISTASCGRPPSLLAAQQLVPASGLTNVSTSIGTLYFVAYFQNGAALSGNLHLIVGEHGTLEGGPLVAATAPPGTVFPTPIPIPNATGQVVSASVPTLAAAQHYQTQLYNDTCQSAVLAGVFST